MANGYTKVSNGIMQINNIIHTGTDINKLITKGGSIHSTMFLIISIRWICIDQLKYSQTWSNEHVQKKTIRSRWTISVGTKTFS